MFRRISKRAGKKTPPVARLIGFRLLRAQRGRAVCSLLAKKQHENTIGTVHGGILCDLSDAAMGFAFESLLPSDGRGVTVEFKINFLKPVYAGQELRALARTLSHGRNLYYLECEIRNPKGRLVAKAASTCKVVSPSRTRMPKIEGGGRQNGL